MADQQARDLTGANTEWLRRPWARTFDLIQARYGWSDEAVLDLTPARVRQLRSVILAAKREDHVVQVRLAERVTREIVAHTRAAAGDKKAGKAAEKVSFLSERTAASPGPKQLPSFEAVSQKFGAPPPAEG